MGKCQSEDRYRRSKFYRPEYVLFTITETGFICSERIKDPRMEDRHEDTVDDRQTQSCPKAERRDLFCPFGVSDTKVPGYNAGASYAEKVREGCAENKER